MGKGTLSVAVGLLGLASLAALSSRATSAALAPPLPTDPRLWLGAPVDWKALAGRVVLLDVWTFG